MTDPKFRGTVIVCDHVYKAEGSGKAIISGTFTEIYALGDLLTAKFMVYARFQVLIEDIQKKYDARLWIIDLDQQPGSRRFRRQLQRLLRRLLRRLPR